MRAGPRADSRKETESEPDIDGRMGGGGIRRVRLLALDSKSKPLHRPKCRNFATLSMPVIFYKEDVHPLPQLLAFVGIARF